MKTNHPSNDEPASVIDTSKMTPGERAALEMAEAAREATETLSLGAGIFFGSPNLAGLMPFPAQSLEDRDQGDAFLAKLQDVLIKADPDMIDAEGEIPDEVIKQLAAIGAFGIKVPVKNGGLGLSQTNYARAAMKLGAVCGNLTALLSAHQSIGVPQPLIMFGTEEQKAKFLPRVAGGEISAFALTERGVGSDPAKMKTEAVPTENGEAFLINGEKLWCTNGTKAGVIVVMARTPAKVVNGKPKDQVTAFIVEMNTPGIEVIHRCRFMGLRALYNGVIRFRDVRVPRENIILGEGKGLKVALSTLNTGRITLPAACAGLARSCLDACLAWSKERVQWGAPIGHHAAIADKLARMAANAFAMESMTLAVSGLVDRDKKGDIRIEAALAKLWATERAWDIVNDTMQIRGGRGYETAHSLAQRGEPGIAVERWMRDCRINTIFEGSSEIMRLFVAREALDPHLKIGAAVFNSTLAAKARVWAALRAGLFYAGWYPRRWLPINTTPSGIHPRLRRHAKKAQSLSRKLARTLFHAMARFGPKLDKQQVLLGRCVDIGAEIFAMISTVSHASFLAASHSPRAEEALSLADYFAQLATARASALFHANRNNVDKPGYQLARQLLEANSSA